MNAPAERPFEGPRVFRDIVPDRRQDLLRDFGQDGFNYISDFR